MPNTYAYTTVEQQIEKLKSQNLSFVDEEFAKDMLRIYGYYNIINGYRDPYIIRLYDKKIYSPDITFEQIFSLFAFDHNIRNAILLSMIDLEEHLKALCADIISDSFGSDYNIYLDKNNYRDKYVKDPKFRRNSILSSMIKVAQTSHTQPVKYYRDTHNCIPPWILFKGIFFGTLVNYIRFFKRTQREKLIQALYGSKVNSTNMNMYKDLLSDTLFMCLEYRNLAAHGGRVYNYIPQCSIRPINNNQVNPGLPQLMQCLKELSYRQPYGRLIKALNNSLTDYCSEYPVDVNRLEQATGFTITSETRTWVNERTKKYHSIQHCSGSQNCIRMSLHDAQEAGYVPCKKCVN